MISVVASRCELTSARIASLTGAGANAASRGGGRGQVAVSRAGMKIPAGVFLDAINRVLLVHDQIVVRIGVAPDVVGVEDFGITNAVGVRRLAAAAGATSALAWWNTRTETTRE